MSIADTAEYQLEQMQRTLDKRFGMITRIGKRYEPGNAYLEGYKDALKDMAQDMGLEIPE